MLSSFNNSANGTALLVLLPMFINQLKPFFDPESSLAVSLAGGEVDDVELGGAMVGTVGGGIGVGSVMGTVLELVAGVVELEDGGFDCFGVDGLVAGRGSVATCFVLDLGSFVGMPALFSNLKYISATDISDPLLPLTSFLSTNPTIAVTTTQAVTIPHIFGCCHKGGGGGGAFEKKPFLVTKDLLTFSLKLLLLSLHF